MAETSGRAPVLFLHSLGGNAGQWKAQIEHLMPERLALAVDLPGHGVSDLPEGGDCSPAAMAAEVGSVLDALDLAPMILVGHSYGASVAIALLAERPGSVAGLLLVDPGPDLRGEAALEIEGFLGKLAPDSYEETILAHFESALTGGRAEVRSAVLDLLAATPRDVVVGALESLPDFDPVPPLEEYDGPRLSVIAEQHDGAAALHVVVDNLPVRKLSGASHWLQMDRPNEFNAIMDEFLATVDGASAVDSA
jgi:pimeloyl-ACP methyl ester carboxylesterase